ncbi:MAG: hypothetical protein CMD81_07245 [Gammaproteobacteria bacterium]|nr:hypothetical protein [Gammaproteobacteria bacterium]HBF08967.1 hypothetical protein [Gammaproteobacteria bacterium]
MQIYRQSSIQMNYKQQQGVTLVIGLALLLVLALISHSSAEIGLNNEKVAHNTKLILEAEQAALSANQQAFETTNYINEALRYIDEPQFDAWPEYDLDTRQTHQIATAKLSVSRVALKGYSLNSGQSVKQVLLEVDSTAEINNRVDRRVAQGWIRVGAN